VRTGTRAGAAAWLKGGKMPKKWSPTQQQLQNKRIIVIDGISVVIEQCVINGQERDSESESDGPRGRPDVVDVGKVLWPAAGFLIEYLKFAFDEWSGVSVLELGCGPGLAGIYLGLCGAECVLTDMENVVELTKRNVDLNFSSECRSASSSDGVPVTTLVPLVTSYDWNMDSANISDSLKKHFDFIIASDVMYEPNNYEALMQVISRHCTSTTRVYIGYQLRTGDEFTYVKESLSLLGFDVGIVSVENLPPRYYYY
jgi:predicted nicotinamide N-methyase